MGQDGDRMVSRHLRRGAVKTRGPPAEKRSARATVYEQYVGAYAGRRFRKVRARLMVRAFSSGGSFPGKHRDLRIRRQLARKHLDKIDEALKYQDHCPSADAPQHLGGNPASFIRTGTDRSYVH